MAKNLENVKCAGCICFRLEGPQVYFLLVKSRKVKDDIWGFPKGHVETGEEIASAAIRETYEETGIIAKLLYEFRPVFTNTPTEFKTVHFWLSSLLDPKKFEPNAQLKEVSEAKWFNIIDLPAIYNYQMPLAKESISLILSNLDK